VLPRRGVRYRVGPELKLALWLWDLYLEVGFEPEAGRRGDGAGAESVVKSSEKGSNFMKDVVLAGCVRGDTGGTGRRRTGARRRG
jgi:hypothetical protein